MQSQKQVSIYARHKIIEPGRVEFMTLALGIEVHEMVGTYAPH